jgi:hypothetical protein
MRRQKLECLKQINKNVQFEYGLSMEFEDQRSYDQDNLHPDRIVGQNN